MRLTKCTNRHQKESHWAECDLGWRSQPESRASCLHRREAQLSGGINEADSAWRSYHHIAAPLRGPLMSPHFLTDAWQSRRRRRRLEGDERPAQIRGGKRTTAKVLLPSGDGGNYRQYYLQLWAVSTAALSAALCLRAGGVRPPGTLSSSLLSSPVHFFSLLAVFLIYCTVVLI